MLPRPMTTNEILFLSKPNDLFTLKSNQMHLGIAVPKNSEILKRKFVFE
ncbi:655_t:CDS:2 [Ambispora gerdemannii]|uniref:655_t:CDS:1 n=1 Tax=Ambispora gerdemannii TaxID=144530 RepID=A0A9N9AYF5_9GLOM|nr:655_t:CDS:2 [Ambispora gerdemannii]